MPPPLPLAPALRKHIDGKEVPDDHGPIHPLAFRIVTKSNGRVAQLSNQFWLHDANVHQSVAMCFVGHASPEIHQHYAKVSDGSLRDAAESLPDVA